MTLAYGKQSPKDMLEKARRDLSRLEAAEAAQSMTDVSDALFDFSVSLTSIKDWLKEHPTKSYSPSAVEDFLAKSTALSSFRDVANGGKHRVIRRYVPKTMAVSLSAPSVLVFAPRPAQSSRPGNTFARLKIIRTDGSRHRAVDLGRTAVPEWQVFMQKHGVA